MLPTDNIFEELSGIISDAITGQLNENSFEPFCRKMGVVHLYYDVSVKWLPSDKAHPFNYIPSPVDDPAYNDNKTPLATSPLVLELYNSGEEAGIVRKYTYFYDGQEYVHCYCALKKGVIPDATAEGKLAIFADLCYLLGSRKNMREQLDRVRFLDPLTGIRNTTGVEKEYCAITSMKPAHKFIILRLNLRNFKQINDLGIAHCGNEAIIQYSHKLCELVEQGECVGRLGGDNFVLFIKKENFDSLIEKLKHITLNKMTTLPGKTLEMPAWVGYSELAEGEDKTFSRRLNEAYRACDKAREMHSDVPVKFE